MCYQEPSVQSGETYFNCSTLASFLNRISIFLDLLPCPCLLVVPSITLWFGFSLSCNRYWRREASCWRCISVIIRPCLLRGRSWDWSKSSSSSDCSLVFSSLKVYWNQTVCQSPQCSCSWSVCNQSALWNHGSRQRSYCHYVAHYQEL